MAADAAILDHPVIDALAGNPAARAAVTAAHGERARPVSPDERPPSTDTLSADDYVGDAADRTGFSGLEAVDEVTMVAIPDLIAAYEQGAIDGETLKAVQLALIAHCELMGDRVAIIDRGRIIDVDTPFGFVDRHCKERTIMVATGDERAAERFRAIPGVLGVTGEDGRCTVQGVGDDLVARVIQCLAEHRIHVTDFRTVLPTLEDVFLKLTGHSVRG